MAVFRWDIEDASDAEVSVRESGEVELDDVKFVLVKNWDVENADKTVKADVSQGGEVGDVVSDKSAEKSQNIGSLKLGKRFNQFWVILLTLIFGAGFLIVLDSGVRQGKLDFQTFIAGLLSILALLFGYKNVNSNKE